MMQRQILHNAASSGGSERGVVLPVFALLLVVLLVFAAFTVDLGAAWAERRQDQSAADAAAMAGALEYTKGDATATTSLEARVVEKVKAFAALNLGLTDSDWAGCTDDGAYTLLPDVVTPTNRCISLAQAGVPGAVVRVQLPERQVSTTFAQLIGIDTISVSALAEAQVDYVAFGRVRPWSIPTNSDSQECLGTPPDGLVTDPDPLNPCSGSQSGNFGLLNSGWFGAPSPPTPFGDEQKCPPSDFDTRTSRNIALGLDHPVVEAPGAGVGDGHDDCGALADPTYVPWSLNTATGFQPIPLYEGLVGNGLFGTNGTPALLRQTGGLNGGDGALGRINLRTDAGTDHWLDNVGLWEYLVDPTACVANTLSGREATQAMADCLALAHQAPGQALSFREDLLESPRFAVVPRLDYIRCNDNASDPDCLQGNEWLDIIGYVPVYIQGTWYDCGTPSHECLFAPLDYDIDADEYTPVFYPGEGDSYPVIPNAQGNDYVRPKKLDIKGLSAFVLDWNWLDPPDALGQLGESFPFQVSLYR